MGCCGSYKQKSLSDASWIYLLLMVVVAFSVGVWVLYYIPTQVSLSTRFSAMQQFLPLFLLFLVVFGLTVFGVYYYNTHYKDSTATWNTCLVPGLITFGLPLLVVFLFTLVVRSRALRRASGNIGVRVIGGSSRRVGA